MLWRLFCICFTENQITLPHWWFQVFSLDNNCIIPSHWHFIIFLDKGLFCENHMKTIEQMIIISVKDVVYQNWKTDKMMSIIDVKNSMLKISMLLDSKKEMSTNNIYIFSNKHKSVIHVFKIIKTNEWMTDSYAHLNQYLYANGNVANKEGCK